MIDIKEEVPESVDDIESFNELIKKFNDKGQESGEQISEVLKERGFERAIPLFRSSVLINKTNNGIEIKSWGDPKRAGKEEINDETLAEEPDSTYLLTGTKWGGRIYEKQPNNEWEEMFTLPLAKELISDNLNYEEHTE